MQNGKYNTSISFAVFAIIMIIIAIMGIFVGIGKNVFIPLSCLCTLLFVSLLCLPDEDE